MKRLILYAFGIFILTETPVRADTCSDLGYTQTSTSSCAGEYLICPDNASKFYCIEKTPLLPILFPIGHFLQL